MWIPNDPDQQHMSRENLENFRAVVWADPGLLERLREETDRASFIAQLLSFAEWTGHDITADDIESVMRENYMLWLQRWA